MSVDKKICVLLPVYNDGAFIRETLQSLTAQTYKNFSIKVIDNASTDNTKSEVAPFLADPRIAYHYCDVHVTMVENFRRAIVYIDDSEIIKFMCGDDYLYPNCLEEIVSVFNDNHETVVSTSYERKFGASTEVRKIGKIPMIGEVSGVTAQLLLLKNGNWVGGPHAVAVRSDILTKESFDSDFKCSFDIELWIRLLNYGSIFVIPQILYGSRIHKGQATNLCVKGGFQKDRIKIFKKVASGNNKFNNVVVELAHQKASQSSSLKLFAYARRFSFLVKAGNLVKKTIKSVVKSLAESKFIGYIDYLRYRIIMPNIAVRFKKTIFEINGQYYLTSFLSFEVEVEYLLARIWTSQGMTYKSIFETPHYQLAIDYLKYKNHPIKDRHPYFDYVKNFFPELPPEVLLESKLDLFRKISIKKDVAKQPVAVVFRKPIDHKGETRWVIYDGLHRIALMAAMGKLRVDVCISPVHSDVINKQ